jgi:hypothetical protein
MAADAAPAATAPITSAMGAALDVVQSAAVFAPSGVLTSNSEQASAKMARRTIATLPFLMLA